MCAEGLCGTCLVDVVEGVPEHRDFVLDDDERPPVTPSLSGASLVWH